MTGLLFLYSLAVHLAWLEGKNYGLNAKIAILFCLRNRISYGWENGDLGRIVQSEYYSRYLDKKDLLEVPDIREPDFQQLLSYVQGIFENTIQDVLTAGATHWGLNAPNISLHKIAQVGTLNLWK